MSDPKPRCGSKTRAGGTCQQNRGHRTDHPGLGKCWLHGGRTPNGKKSAQTEGAAAAVAKLGIPLGTGDPFELLETATKYSHGFLEATAAVLVAVVDGERTDISLEAAAKLHVDAIRQGSQTGHQAVTADVASRQAKVSEQLATVVIAAVQNGIGVYVAAIAAGTPAPEALGLAEAAAADVLEVKQPVGAGLN